MTIEKARERLDELRALRTEILQEAEDARKALHAARREFLQRVDGAGARASEAESRIAIVAGSLEVLDADIEEAETALAAAERDGKLGAHMERMESLAGEAASARAEYDAAHEQLAALFTEHVDRTIEAWDSWTTPSELNDNRRLTRASDS